MGGAVPQDGHAKPRRRGIFAMRKSARACFSPPQQLMSMNTAMAKYQTEWTHTASARNAATPTKLKTVTIIRLRARPKTNHSNERRICPPSSGYTGSRLKASNNTSMTKSA